MFKKKDIDLNSLLQKELLKVKNDLFEDKSLLEEEYDPVETVRKMPEISVKPRMWAKAGSVEATELDDVVKALNPTGQDGLSRYKSCIDNLNKVLGTTAGVSGIPVQQDEQISNVNQIFSGIQLKGVMGNIIFNQSPQTAGKIFEALVARMIGGTLPEEETGAIEDLKDASGNFISLKVVDRTTEIKGSKFNLAKGIVEASNQKVNYLILLKDKRRNPFSFKTYSFSLSKDNYFQFLSNGEPLTLKKVQSMISDIAITKSKPPVNEAEEKESNINAYYDTFKKYGQEVLGVESDDVGTIFNAVTKKFSEIMAKSAPSSNPKEKVFYDTFLKFYEPLMLSTPTAKQPINVKMFAGLINDLNNIKNIDDDAKKQIFGDSYQKDYAQLLKKLAPLSQFVDQIDSIYHRSRQRQTDDRAMNAAQAKISDMLAKSSSAEYANEKQSVDAEINKFFALVKSGDLARKEGEKDTQFKLPLAYALQFAKQTKSDYDESYPEVIIDGNILFTSAQNSAELLKAYVEPIYDNFNALDINLKRYFVKNEPRGIKDAQTSTEKLKTAIEDHPGVKQGKAASDITQVQENKTNKPLTKHWSDDILEGILND